MKEGTLDEVCALIQSNLSNLTHRRLKKAIKNAYLCVAVNKFDTDQISNCALLTLFTCRGHACAGAVASAEWEEDVNDSLDPRENLFHILQSSYNPDVEKGDTSVSMKFLLLKELCNGQLKVYPCLAKKGKKPSSDGLYVLNDFDGAAVKRTIEYLRQLQPSTGDVFNRVTQALKKALNP